MDYQTLSDEIFYDLEAGRITRREFYDRYNELFDKIPEDAKKNLKRRMDFGFGRQGRTLGQFALSLYDNTKREALLVYSWAEMINITMKTGVTLSNLGVENSGRLLINSRDGKPDYLMEVNKTGCIGNKEHYTKRPLEVKFTGQLKKLTYKVKDLESYIKNNALVLTIISDGMVGPNGDPDDNSPLAIDASKLQWFTMNPKLMQGLLENIPIRDYREMGWKPAIQLLKVDFPNYLEIKEWGVQ